VVRRTCTPDHPRSVGLLLTPAPTFAVRCDCGRKKRCIELDSPSPRRGDSMRSSPNYFDHLQWRSIKLPKIKLYLKQVDGSGPVGHCRHSVRRITTSVKCLSSQKTKSVIFPDFVSCTRQRTLAVRRAKSIGYRYSTNDKARKHPTPKVHYSEGLLVRRVRVRVKDRVWG